MDQPVTRITNVRSTLFQLSLPFPDLLHSKAIIAHLSKLEVIFHGEKRVHS
jgi:hypothetical protein